MATKGRSLELYFVDGNPEGMLTAEVFNWTGHVLVIPRTRISDGLARREAGYTGVYLLLGDADGRTRAYIGESEDVSSRIRNHDAQKDWWTAAVLITSASNNLHKAHVKYIESRLIEEARDIGRADLENGNTPQRSSLSESGRANMESFIETLMIVLPALRIDMFLSRTRPVIETAIMRETEGPTASFEILSSRIGGAATAVLIDGEFVVQAGSVAWRDWVGVDYATYRRLYEELRQSGVLVLQGETCVFAQNYAFPSPSAAASVILGRSSNGTIEWRLVGGLKTYKQWEADLLGLTSGDSHD